jgi:hypothetical protein
VAKVLVGNKSDRPDRAIASEKGRELAEAHGLTFFETSAKSGLNVNQVFDHIARIIVTEKLGVISGGGQAGNDASAAANLGGAPGKSINSEPIRMLSRQSGQPGENGSGGGGQKQNNGTCC